MKKQKRILVTGGAGFLGSYLCERLLDEGHTVICLDNLYTGNEANIAPLRARQGFSFVFHDVCMPLETLVVDEIYNLACPASPPQYQADPVYTWKTSVLGALNMLELAQRCSAKILQASTSEIYGDPEEHPQKEEYWGHVNPVGLRSCYDEGKRAAETLFLDFHRGQGVRIKIARIFNTYGPRMDPQDGRVVSNLIMQALKNEPLTIYGEGKQSRSFCFVDDLVDALKLLMDSPDHFLGPVNLGNPVEYTVLELAQIILEMTRSKSPLVFKPLPSDDPKQRCPDISLAKEVLGWQPRVLLREGLSRSIAYFKTVEPDEISRHFLTS